LNARQFLLCTLTFSIISISHAGSSGTDYANSTELVISQDVLSFEEAARQLGIQLPTPTRWPDVLTIEQALALERGEPFPSAVPRRSYSIEEFKAFERGEPIPPRPKHTRIQPKVPKRGSFAFITLPTSQALLFTGTGVLVGLVAFSIVISLGRKGKSALITQQAILFSALILIVFLGLYPPWIQFARSTIIDIGYAPLWSPPDTTIRDINYPRLFTQWTMVALLAGGGILLVRMGQGGEARTTSDEKVSGQESSHPMFVSLTNSQPTTGEIEQQRNYGGIRRLGYFFGTLGLSASLQIYMGIFHLKPDPTTIFIELFIEFILVLSLTFVLVVNRLRNIGMSGWWSVGMLVPIANVYLGVKCLACPEGYQDTKKLDSAGKVIAGIFIGVLTFCITVIVIAFIS